MRIFGVFLVLFLTGVSFCFAGSILDELVSATKGDATEEQLVSLKEKYKGSTVSGEGYVLDVETEGFTVYVTLIVNKEDLSSAVVPNVNIEVPQSSSYIDIAKNLKKKQEVSFAGRFYDIFAGTIYIEGEVSITPQ